MQVQASVGMADGSVVDVTIDADDDVPVGRLAAAIGRSLGIPADGLYGDGVRWADDQPVGTSGLVDGTVVHLRAAPPVRSQRSDGGARWQLRVVSGPDSGLVLDLPPGATELGRGAPPGFADPSMSRRHAQLRVDPDGAELTDLGSANGSYVEGTRVTGSVRVRPGEMFQLGDTQLVLRPPAQADAAIEPASPGTRAFVRAPRLLPHRRPVRIALPKEPTAKETRRIPVLAMLMPLAFAVVMALVLRNPLFLMFGLASPIMLLANVISDRRHHGREYRRARQEYERRLAEVDVLVDEAVAQETARRRDDHPDAASILLTARLPLKRLWERRRADADALDLRLGVADLPAEVAVVGSDGKEVPERSRTATAVPVVVGLREAGVLGLSGPSDSLAGLLRWLVLQLTVLHPPRDLGVTVLCPRARSDWAWVRWLPHARPADGEGPVASVGNDGDTARDRVSELVALVRARREALKAHGGSSRPDAFPAHVVVVDGMRALRNTPGLGQLLQEGPAVGVYGICADEEERFLPEAATSTAVFSVEDPALVDIHRSRQEPVLAVLAEAVSPAVAETAARALAPLRDVSLEEDDAVLPDSVRLLDMLDLEPPTPEGVLGHWRRGGNTTRFVLGAGATGPFHLDLRTDGPHGLVAGTTGAGKSELLQSLIAALAVANRPDALNFVLVDYKGGSAFKECVRLPHTVGMVTDLDAHLVQRALTSLGAELRYREHVLDQADVANVDRYQDLRTREPARPPLPRLLIVIDEFAAMAKELPDFVSGLVNVAQRGRSLGIHLILATQRPGSVVSADIRANANLRLCLRVTSTAESADVLEGAPDAARIPKSVPGRAVARLGHGVLVPFQAGRVGGRRPGQGAVAPEPFVARVGWPDLGVAPPERPKALTVSSDVGLTDLSVLVESVAAAAQAEGAVTPRRPWLPPLPESLPVSSLEVEDALALPFGLRDLPEHQAQRPATFDPARDGHLLVIGAPKTGRSQLLRTLAGAAGRRCSVRDVHLYGLDCGNGALLPMQELPHCGAVVMRTQTERAVRLFERLARELDRRQQTLSDGGYADVTEQRRAAAPEERLPHLLLLLDRWEGFVPTLGEVEGGRLTEILMRILREGGSAGISAALTGDRSLGTSRLSSLTDNKLVMRLADRGDYPMMGVGSKQVPDTMPPGRAVTADGALEVQVALLADDSSGAGQAAALAEIAAAARQREGVVPQQLRPFRVDVLPSRISFEEAWKLPRPHEGGLLGLVGVGGDELACVGPDLAGGPAAFVVAGPGRSGKSTVLAVMAEAVLRQGGRVVLGAPKPSPLRDLAGRDGVLGVVEEAGAPLDAWAALLDTTPHGPVVVLLDDAEVLRESPAGELFRSIVRGTAQRPGLRLVLGGNADSICTGLSGWQVDAKRSRQGALLSPQQTMDGDLVGVRVPRSIVGQPVQPGRALVHLGDGALLTVAVPAPPPTG